MGFTEIRYENVVVREEYQSLKINKQAFSSKVKEEKLVDVIDDIDNYLQTK